VGKSGRLHTGGCIRMLHIETKRSVRGRHFGTVEIIINSGVLQVTPCYFRATHFRRFRESFFFVCRAQQSE
jgi:hypothetical protein